MARFQVEHREWRPLPVKPDTLLTLTEAAERLGISLNSLAGLIQRGTLSRVEDVEEPNPTKRSRVLASELERELARRRSRKREGDARLRGKVR